MNILHRTLLSGIAALLVFSTVAQAGTPHMLITLDLLHKAKAQLKQAASDKGNHRAHALRAIDTAIAEVQAGIAYDKTHYSGANENKKKKK